MVFLGERKLCKRLEFWLGGVEEYLLKEEIILGKELP